jgi:predicted dehydrogenase
MKTIRWGILSTARIAAAFCEALQMVPDAELVAVGSRTLEAAAAFGQRFDIPHCHGSYEALARDPEVDVIYVCTPHIFHYDHALLCLQQHKHVLCEKAFTMNARQAEELIQTARAKGLFLMEAMWTRFFPIVEPLKQTLRDGAIGEVALLSLDFPAYRAFDPEDRLFKKELGGGALLDLGVYPVSFASMLLGAPEEVCGVAQFGPTQVDVQSAYTLKYASGAIASLAASFRTPAARSAVIYGTHGFIRMQGEWFHPSAFTVVADGREDTVERPYAGNGYQFEIQAATEAIQRGDTESPFMPLDETLQIMRTLDRLRASWGLVYPGE